MRYAPEDEESDRDKRTVDVIFWLAPVAAGAVVVLPLLFVLTGLLGADADRVFAFLCFGVPAIATVGFGARHALRARRINEFGLSDRSDRPSG